MKTRKIFALVLLVFTFFMASCANKENVTISFFDNDYSLINEYTIEKGSKLTEEITNPEDKEDQVALYKFHAWFDGSLSYYKSEDVLNMVFNESKTFVASYNSYPFGMTSYTVNFKVNGKYFASQKVLENSILKRVPNPADFTENGVNYKFVGWDRDLTAPIVSDTDINAIFTEEKVVKVTFLNGDGSVLQTKNVVFGRVPSIKLTPTKTSDANGYIYKFVSWDKPLVSVFGDVTYTPIFEKVKEVTVTFKNADGTIIETNKLPQGSVPVCSKTPTQATKTGVDYDIQYKFSKWDKEITPILKDETYTAVYEEQKVVNIVFKNYNGTTLERQTIPYNSNVTYKGKTPTRPSRTSGSTKYTYTFTGWDKSLYDVTTHTTYTAQYRESTETVVTDVDKIRNHLLTYGEPQDHCVTTNRKYSGTLTILSELGINGDNFQVACVSKDSSSSMMCGVVLIATYGSSMLNGQFIIGNGSTIVFVANTTVHTSNHKYSFANATIVESQLNYSDTENAKRICEMLTVEAVDSASDYLSTKGLPYIY